MYKAEVLKAKTQKDKNNYPWSVNPPTIWGVLNSEGFPVAYVPDNLGESMAHLIAKLLNQNTKYKIKKN
jgi:hypothetical protein